MARSDGPVGLREHASRASEAVRALRAEARRLQAEVVTALRESRRISRRARDDRGVARAAAFERLPLPAAIVGSAGTVDAVNSSWQRSRPLGHVIRPGSEFGAVWTGMTGDRFIEDAIETVARTRTPVQVETTLPGQRPRRLLVQLGAAASEDDRSVLIVAVDITAQFERERSLMFEATHDQLTGLANRALVRRAVRDSLARFKRYDEAFALIYLDLDSFKPLNDRLGHAAGDSVLRDLAGRWDRLVRSPDVLGRIGGDEFVAVMQHAGDLEGANRLAGRLVGALDQPFVIGTRVVDVSVTAGVVLPPADADVDAALALADRAMYSHKPEPDELPVQRTEPGFMRHG